MSPSPFDRSPDLARLLDDGYDAAVEEGSLVIRGVPYVTSGRVVMFGTVVIPLELAGDATVRPTRHQSRFLGRRPCDGDGGPLEGVTRRTPDSHDGSTAGWELCLWPGRDFANFHEFAVTHVRHYEAQAALVVPGSTARNGDATAGSAASGPFEYADTASARDGIERHARRLDGLRVGIVGLGGTGSYVLDLVAKTPVAEIRLFDDDVFLQHNAFRAPGAPGAGEITGDVAKVHHFAAIYARMHSGVIPHRVRLGRGNACLLGGLDFVFLCIDDPTAKGPLLARLDRGRIPFVDCGIGLYETGDGLAGLVRTTSVDGGDGGWLASAGLLPASAGDDDPYAFRAQVADLNALNAALAVIAWKRRYGFYSGDGAGHWVYVVDAGALIGKT